MKDLPDQVHKLETERQNLGLTFPVGLDPTDKKDVFGAYSANVGSATLVFVDPLGRIVYYEQDPRPNAFGLFDRVFSRLLENK